MTGPLFSNDSRSCIFCYKQAQNIRWIFIQSLKGKRVGLRKRLRYFLCGFVILMVLVLLAPLSPRTTSVYLDLVNGRHKTVERLFGFVRSEKLGETDFSELVAKHNLQGEPEWVRISYVGSGLFGGFEFCAIPYHAELWTDYGKFAGKYYPSSGMDDPTTTILEIRRLARIGHGREVGQFIMKYREAVAAADHGQL